jgi:hypothetical protein
LAEVVYAKLWFSGRASGSPATGANTDGKVMSLLVMPPQLDDILIQKGFPPTVYIRR